MEVFEKQILAWFDHFHAIPEVSWKEFTTTQSIASILDNLGVTYRTFSDVTGLIAEIGEGDEVIGYEQKLMHYGRKLMEFGRVTTPVATMPLFRWYLERFYI